MSAIQSFSAAEHTGPFLDQGKSSQPASRRYVAIALAVLAVLLSIATADYIGWLRLKPEVSAVDLIESQPDYESHILNIHQRAIARAHGAPDSFLPIYDIQNPGFFLLVAELYIRAGATTPLPLEITSIVLFNFAAIFFFFWVYLLFEDLLVATLAAAFLTLSQFFLFFPGVTHTFPYEFFFFNATMFLYVLFLRTNRTGYLVASLLAMFMTCMNYWFYYMSSWIILVGLWWQYRGRPSFKEIAILSTPPIAAAGLTTIMVMSLFGIKGGAMRMADVFVARVMDARLPGGAWYPNQRFMTSSDWLHYPLTVMDRLKLAYSIDLYSFMAAGCAFFLLWFQNRKALISALILFAGGFSWYCVMFQHTHIHHFVGQYSFMAICPIFGLMMAETLRLTGRVLAHPIDTGRKLLKHGRIFAAGLLFVLGWKAAYDYVRNTTHLIRQTVEISETVEVKYAEAIKTICRDHSQITLADLQAASKDWGFVWHPDLITETNRTPLCGHEPRSG